MVETQAISGTQDPSADTLERGVEIQTINSESDDEGGQGESSAKDDRFLSLTEKGDIEAYRIPNNELCGKKETAVTRTSTKSSWKDPGPPPDGGMSAWAQGMAF